MKYEKELLEILYNLGIRKMYKGCEYILYGIHYISENEANFSPITKILYVEIAKEYSTSNLCIEKNIRSVIELIWKESTNDVWISRVFGNYYLLKRPSNLEFLTSLYHYVRNTTSQYSLPDRKNPGFICPMSGNECEYCRDYISNFLKEYKIPPHSAKL